jgi:hypothetical protein
VSEISVTIKYDKGHDATWAVFKGSLSEVREGVVDFFGFDRASVAELTLNQLAINATQVAHGGGNAAASLGAVALASKTAAPPAQSAPAAPEDPWAAAGQPASPGSAAPAQPEANPMLARIEGCATTDDLKKLWATNQAAFADSAVMDAWKAKGRALKVAA